MITRERLVKMASTRVMREFLHDTLSPGVRAQAREFLPSTERMTNGLDAGSKNILANTGTKLKMLGPALSPIERIQYAYNQKKNPFAGMHDPRVRDLERRMIGSHYNPDEKTVYLQKGQLTPKGATPEEAAYADAITLRHEAHERLAENDPIGLAREKAGKPRSWANAWSLPGGILNQHFRVGTGSHYAPSVLLDESRNAALAPTRLRSHFQKLRGLGTPYKEADLLSKGGFTYGVSAPATASEMRTANKRMWGQYDNSTLPYRSGPMDLIQHSNTIEALKRNLNANKLARPLVQEEVSAAKQRFATYLKQLPKRIEEKSALTIASPFFHQQYPHMTPQEVEEYGKKRLLS